MKKQAMNPYLPLNVCIADGEPHVFGDRVYVFGSHDRPCGETFCELDYEVWSAPVEDLGDWISHGIVYSAKQDSGYSERKSWNYGQRAKRDHFFAQVWNPLHDPDELREYPKEVSELDV